MQMRGRRLTLSLAAVLGIGLMLVGCDDEATPGQPSAPSASPAVPTPIPSPTPEAPLPPARPEAMATNDEAGAVAAAQFFMTELYDHMFATGDVADWSVLADDGCNFCNSVLTLVDEMNAAKQTETSEPTVVISSESSTLVDGTRFAVTLVAQQGASRRVDSTGTTVESSDGGLYSLNFAVAWVGDWSMLAVDAVPITDGSS